MSSRHGDSSKGSSRSRHDDSRTHKEKYAEEKQRLSRSKSRSPHRADSTSDKRHTSSKSEKHSHSQSNDSKNQDKASKTIIQNEWEDSDEEVPPPPTPPRINKISIGFTKPKEPIKMTLGNTSKPLVNSQKLTVASVFNEDDDDEVPEEMPAEARMRMRNIGRETPTSAGPNSFGKTKQGFCDAKKVFEKNLKQALETNQVEKPSGQFPQTIYKIKGP